MSKLNLVTAVFLSVLFFSAPVVAQTPLRMGHYQDKKYSNQYQYSEIIVAETANGGNSLRHHIHLTSAGCTGFWDINLDYDVPANYGNPGRPPINYTTGTCRGEAVCSGVIIRCNGIQAAPAVFKQLDKGHISVAGPFYTGTFDRSGVVAEAERKGGTLTARYRIIKGGSLEKNHRDIIVTSIRRR